MTWRTQNGVRVLAGAEADLVREAIGHMTDMLDDLVKFGEDAMGEFGVEAFDTLAPNAKVSMLADVGWALLRDTDTCPELTAISEGAVAAIYSHIDESLEFEIDYSVDMEDPTFWRRRVLDAYKEGGDLDDLPEVNDADHSEWRLLLECLMDRVLWDRDFEDGDLFLDSPREQSSLNDTEFSENYFTAIAPDPRDSEMPAVMAKLQELCRE